MARFLSLALMLASSLPACAQAQVECWLTDPSGTARFERQKSPIPFRDTRAGIPIIQVKPEQAFQSIDGFGYTLNGGSAGHLMAMTPARRAELLRELFTTQGQGIGVSYLRLSIGASDLDCKVFSYDDLPVGEEDPDLKRFSLEPDRQFLIPVLKEILALAPDISIMASPWSPPVWMKDNRNSVGGGLLPRHHGTYARYFVKYIQAMGAAGIRIHAVTIQNEPLHAGNNPSLLMPASQQAEFIKNHLGPAFRDAGLDTKILIYDHNCDKPEYPLAILADPQAKKWVDGSAFHLYGGKIDALSKVRAAHPDKNLYFTEQWIGAPGNLRGDLAWHTRELTIGAIRNWSRTVLEWNLASNSRLEPHTPGGCDKCLGALTVDGDTVTRNPAYYVIAHAARFARPGTVRIGSTLEPPLHNVALKAPDGSKILLVLNDGPNAREFQITENGVSAPAKLPSGAVATFVWK